jgi:cytochrome c biogenesis protein CcmG/thiol:disulfide interchange protein DsbE
VIRKAAILVAVAGLAAALYLSFHSPGWRKRSADFPAPAVNLTDLSGQTINFATYKGKVVLVNFWAAWCAPCRDEIPQFIALQNKYGPQGLQAVGISMDDPESTLRDFCQKYKLNYPVVMGSQNIAEEFGGVLGLPTTFLIGRDGRIHTKDVGATDFSSLEHEITALLRAR